MIFIILLIVAAWFLPLPLALQIMITIFGSLRCIVILVRGIVKATKKSDEEQVNSLIKDYLPRH